MKLQKHFKAKAAIGFGILLSIVLVIKLYLWVYNLLLKDSVDRLSGLLTRYVPLAADIGMAAMYVLVFVLATVATFVVCYVVGSMAGTFVGRTVKSTVGRVLSKVPGYSMLSKVVRNILDGGGQQFNRFGIAFQQPIDPEKGVSDQVGMPVIITGESDTHYSVMTPSAPTPMSGFIYIYPKSHVRLVDVTLEEFFSNIVAMGAGVLDLMDESKMISQDDRASRLQSSVQ